MRLCPKCDNFLLLSNFPDKATGKDYYYCAASRKTGCKYKELTDGTQIEIGATWRN